MVRVKVTPNKKTLVLDLDETLVHYNKYNNEYDVKLEVQQNDKNL